ncbi:MAG TPA: hypothetical protein VF693_06805 [Allosphingosinicella sp.]|jgi:hypothetical protein
MRNRVFAVLAAAALTAAPAGAQPPADAPVAQAPALSVDYLVGGWIPTDTDNRCGTDTAMEYRADGTWSTFGRGGPYSVRGDRITLRSTNGEPSNEHVVTIVGPNQYRVQVVGGPAFEMRRCEPDEAAPGKGG